MKDKGARKKADEDAKTIRELREQMANLRSSDVKRLEEMNAQAIALERERDRQRLFREEQALKARGELSKLEAERIAKDREMQERINRTMAEQEKAKRDEVAALAAEQDKIKRAQLENEQRWNDLSRKAKLAQDSWTAIDDSLSLKQAMEEVKDLKKEIANIKNRLDFQYEENIKNLKAAYAQQRALSGAKMPPTPAPKDAFETTTEYNARISVYERQVRAVQSDTNDALEMLKKEETLKLAEAKVDYLGQQIRVLIPFVERLQKLQARKFTLPEGGTVTVELGTPDTDNDRFPIRLQYNGNSWSEWWKYTDRNVAKDFYRTRTYLKAEGLFQIEEATKLSPKLVAVQIIHLGTKEMRLYNLETPRSFNEIVQLSQLKQDVETAQASHKLAARKLLLAEIGNDGRFVAYNNGTVLDQKSGLIWAARDNRRNINWANAKSYCESYRGGGYTDWRMPTQAELEELYDSHKTYDSSDGDVHLTELIRISCCWVWASETRGSDAAHFNYDDGKHYWAPQAIGYYRALPVRNGK
jgi:hypothetical protein